MPKQQHVDINLVGKTIEQLTGAELENVAAQVEARRAAIREQMEKEQLDKIAVTAKEAAQVLGWAKLPKLVLTATESGDAYHVEYVATKVKGTTVKAGRAKSDVNGGNITIKKIGLAIGGGIAYFKDKDGNQYKTLKELVMGLSQADGNPEADRCYDISKKGIAASDIVTKYHADEVTLVFNDGTEKLVKDAVDEMKTARMVA
jgi:hypothetical protein